MNIIKPISYDLCVADTLNPMINVLFSTHELIPNNLKGSKLHKVL